MNAGRGDFYRIFFHSLFSQSSLLSDHPFPHNILPGVKLQLFLCPENSVKCSSHLIFISLLIQKTDSSDNDLIIYRPRPRLIDKAAVVFVVLQQALPHWVHTKKMLVSYIKRIKH